MRKCEWCGREVYNPLDLFKENPYCSFTCRMAGLFYMIICFSILMTLMAITLTNILTNPVIPGLNLEWLLYLTWGGTIFLWCGAYVGYRVRGKKNKDTEPNGMKLRAFWMNKKWWWT
ncbi:MAG: hypothetical protein E4H14_13470 [Candidatus Thorarchaeota archaeon]|nr:MAG: hypothetical protein E4H14_13470 [Candidatus Thorarchaeota archaeon]